MPDDPTPDPDAWIERVVAVGTALGMNPTRLRWKLIRWQERRRQARRRLEQKVLHVTYAHKTCPVCGAVQDRSEATCTQCEQPLGRHGFAVLRRLGLAAPVALSVSTLLALALIAVHIRVIAESGGGIGSPSSRLLIDLGGRWPPLLATEPWRYVTSVLLHAGLWHLAFNLIALAMIGPQVEDAYGRFTMLFVFVVTGTLANVGSVALGVAGVGIGASGGIMGLIGVIAGHGQRLGTSYGRSVRNDMLKWTAYTIVFGFAVGADNWAHLVGGLVGAAFGYLVAPRRWGRPALAPLRAIVGALGALVIAGALAIIFARTVRPVADAYPLTARAASWPHAAATSLPPE